MPIKKLSHLDIRLLIDKGCFELFIEEGLSCMAAICFPKIHSGKILFYNKGNSEFEITELFMKPIRRAEWKC
jgi:sucrose-6-phosphate hydrolase SacC (GH32 family)